ncbi:MAG: pitrilysin family protein [Candidatus Aminicenantales bacterium]
MRKIALYAFAFFILLSPLKGAQTIPEPETIQLKNGLTVFFLEQSELPLVAFRLILKGAGTAYEPVEGLADLTAQLLLKGTTEKSAEVIAEEIEFLGASFSSEAQSELMEMSGSSLAENFTAFMTIVSDCLLRPALNSKEFEKERQRRIETIKSIKDNPGWAVRYYFRKVYFASHPMGHLDIGTQTSLENMNVQNVRDFYSHYIRPEQAIMAVVGNITSDALKRLLNSTLSGWSRTGSPVSPPKLPDFPVLQGKTCVLIDMPDASQAYFVLGVPGYRMGDDRTPAAEVLNTLFGGRFTSWLNTELRIKRGLTYGASSRFQSWREGGIFTISSYTRNDKIGEMLDITFDLLAKARTEGFQMDEIESSKNYICGQFPPTLESLLAKVDAFTTLSFYDLGFDYYEELLEQIEQMAKAKVDAAARQFLPAQDYVLVLVGRAEDIRQQLAKFGNFREKKISEPGFSSK